MLIKTKNIFLNQKTIKNNEKILFIADYDLPKEIIDKINNFLLEIFPLENPITIKIRGGSIKNELYKNFISVFSLISLMAGTVYGIYNDYPPYTMTTWFFALSFTTRKLIKNIPDGIRNGASFHRVLKTIFLGKEYQTNPFVIIHEVIHALNEKKIIANDIDTYLARTIQITAMLIEKKDFEDYCSGNNKKYFQKGEKYFYDQTGSKKIISKISNIQKGKFFSKKIFSEKYHLGMFIAGIVKAMLDNRLEYSKIYNFLGLLAQGTLLEESLEKSINSDSQPTSQ
jgi:hypothetical protein